MNIKTNNKHVKFERDDAYTFVDLQTNNHQIDRILVAATDPIIPTPSRFDVRHTIIVQWIISDQLHNNEREIPPIFLFDELKQQVEIQRHSLKSMQEVEQFFASRRTYHDPIPLPSYLIAALLNSQHTAPNSLRHPSKPRQAQMR